MIQHSRQLSCEKPLSKLRPGHKGIVTKINCTGSVKQRLIDMGITPGVKLAVVKAAPLGDPIQIHLRGYALSIRRQDAAQISVRGTGEKGGKA